MFSRTYIVPATLLMLGGARLASAGSYDEGQWVTTFTAGSHLIPSETLNSPVTGAIVDLGNVDPTLSGIPAQTTLNHLSFNDAFQPGPAFGIETGYMAQSNLEPFVRLTYSQMRGRTTTIGGVDSPVFFTPATIGADFADMDSWALNLGTRYFFVDTGPVRGFVAGYLGVDRVDALRASLSISGEPQATANAEFLPQQTRFDAGVEGGVAWQISDQADLSLSLGAQYVNSRHEQTTVFAPLGLDTVSFSDPHWTVPIDLGLSYRF